MSVANSVAFTVNDCFQSVRHSTNEILKSCHRHWSPGFAKSALECFQCLWLWVSKTVVAIMPQTFSIGERSGEFGGQSSGGIYCQIQQGYLSSWRVCTSTILLKQSITIARKQLCRSQVNADLRVFGSIQAWLLSRVFLWCSNWNLQKFSVEWYKALLDLLQLFLPTPTKMDWISLVVHEERNALVSPT